MNHRFARLDTVCLLSRIISFKKRASVVHQCPKLQSSALEFTNVAKAPVSYLAYLIALGQQLMQ
jgi:hypothetical protein